MTPAAVLVALFSVDGDLHAVFTRRRADLRNHAGQISFPGGRRDAADASLAATALREAHEEIGLDPAAVRLLGALQPTPTIATNFVIYPFVGLIEPGQVWTLSPREVDEVLELSLRALREGYERRDVTRRGVTFRTDAYVSGEHVVWGATARILADLYERLEAAPG
jgi:8-oxo-dGTP pyrophosphatase MutT (NUDIX family)